MGTNRVIETAKAATLLVAALVFASIAAAQSIQVQGIINSRSGASMTLQTDP